MNDSIGYKVSVVKLSAVRPCPPMARCGRAPWPCCCSSRTCRRSCRLCLLGGMRTSRDHDQRFKGLYTLRQQAHNTKNKMMTTETLNPCFFHHSGHLTNPSFFSKEPSRYPLSWDFSACCWPMLKWKMFVDHSSYGSGGALCARHVMISRTNNKEVAQEMQTAMSCGVLSNLLLLCHICVV